jgi:hypothetical protein
MARSIAKSFEGTERFKLPRKLGAGGIDRHHPSTRVEGEALSEPSELQSAPSFRRSRNISSLLVVGSELPARLQSPRKLPAA